MWVDNKTLKDIGLFDDDESVGLITHLNFCKTNGGKAQLDIYLSKPLSSITAIENRQAAITELIYEIEFIQQMKITNGTTLVIEKFFSTGFASIPANINMPSAYWYQLINAADYTLLKYSVDHIVLFYQNLMQWLKVFENKEDSLIISTLVQNIKAITHHPALAKLSQHTDLEKPQHLLSLAHLCRYQYKNNIFQLLQLFYELDAYYSMACAVKNYQFVFPTWIESEFPKLDILSAIHPLVTRPIANDISLSYNSNLFFLTGANMAGKSTFIKTIGIVIYLAHVGIGAPVKKISLSLMDGLITNLTIADNIIKGESYFFNEVQSIKNTIEKLLDGKKYFVLIDELFKGTNIQDAMKCSTTVLEGLQNVRNSLFIISTHLYEISDGLKKYDNIQFRYFETEVHEKALVFHYQLKQGVSQDRLGYLILEREGVVDMLKNIPKTKY